MSAVLVLLLVVPLLVAVLCLVSRSAVVNLDRIKELQPLFHGEYAVTLHNGPVLTLSRRYRHKLPQLGLD